jgi:hypothetical protein
MAVVYGQAYKGMMDPANYKDYDADHQLFLRTINGDEDIAKKIHNCIVRSLGKLGGLMKTVKSMCFEWDVEQECFVPRLNKALTFRMPDGFKVAMQYHKSIQLGYDITMTCNGMMYKALNPSYKTKEVAYEDHGRTGVVRLIHSVDALIARLIVHYAGQTCDHVVAIHDCFRVNINDFIAGKLHVAVRDAYKALFGGTSMAPTALLPYGKDILGLFDAGVVKAGGVSGNLTQSSYTGVRKFQAIKGQRVDDLIDGVLDGSTYYFAK